MICSVHIHLYFFLYHETENKFCLLCDERKKVDMHNNLKRQCHEIFYLWIFLRWQVFMELFKFEIITMVKATAQNRSEGVKLRNLLTHVSHAIVDYHVFQQ